MVRKTVGEPARSPASMSKWKSPTTNVSSALTPMVRAASRIPSGCGLGKTPSSLEMMTSKSEEPMEGKFSRARTTAARLFRLTTASGRPLSCSSRISSSAPSLGRDRAAPSISKRWRTRRHRRRRSGGSPWMYSNMGAPGGLASSSRSRWKSREPGPVSVPSKSKRIARMVRIGVAFTRLLCAGTPSPDLGVCAVEMIVARKWGIEAGFSRFGGA